MVKKEAQQASTYRPKAGEKVICTHHGFMYEAKVMTVRQDKNNPSEQNFFVHYQGWSKNWDEWVGEDRVVKWNESNEVLMKEQKQSTGKGKGSSVKKHNKSNVSINSLNSTSISISSLGTSLTEEKETFEDKSRERKSAASVTKVPSSSVGQKEVQNESLFEDLDIKRIKPEAKIRLPEELKTWLIDDDNNVKNKKLFIIPAKVPISVMFRDYVNFKKTSTKLTTDKEVALNECILGLKYSFNVMVGAHLLYKFERPQYQSLLKEHGNEVDLTSVYGSVHLLRMLTKLGVMMAFTTLDTKDVQIIVGHIQDILKYIRKQSNLFDVDKSYQVAPPEYIRQYQRAVD